jgi:glycosyltransferase involved in cell wall biosynthesis
VAKWQNEGKIEILYHYKPNGGMHTAHNAAYELLDTELNMCIDSDDYLTDDAVAKILVFWDQNKAENVGAIYALDATKDGKILGEKYPEDMKSFQGWGCKVVVYNDGKIHKVVGDKKCIAVTKYLKKYPPIPVFEGEKFYSLYWKQHFLERDYQILILNEPVCIVEYLPDGASMNKFKQYFTNAKGFQHMRLILMKDSPTLKLRFVECMHYINSSIILKDWTFLSKSTNKLLTFLAIPFGILLHLYVKRNYNKQLQLNK